MEENTKELQQRIKEKEEIVRKLKMVKLHRAKHDATELEKLIEQWRGICQQALQDLAGKLREQSCNSDEINIQKLLEHMKIDPELVKYSIEDDSFA